MFIKVINNYVRFVSKIDFLIEKILYIKMRLKEKLNDFICK